MALKIAVIGATGITGSIFLEILAGENIKIEKIDAVASSSSLGSHASFGDQEIPIQSIENYSFKGIDVVVFATSADISRIYVPKALEAGCRVIDKSDLYRLSSDVPLVIPEINGHEVDWKNTKLIANPNCMATIIAVVLKPLSELSPIKRVVATTFQSVSGSGKRAMDELFNQTKGIFMGKDLTFENFPKQIAFNVIPQVGDIEEKSGYTNEELKTSNELKKILGIDMTVTAIRVPVFVGHSASLNIEFEEEESVPSVRAALKKSPGILVIDKREDGGYITPQEAAGEDEIFVSRIRKDQTHPNGINLWVIGDNLRKGAALNVVQILRKWVDSIF